MKTKWIMLTILIFIFLASLIGCGPRARFAPGDIGTPFSNQTPSTQPLIAAVSAESQPEIVSAVTPTPVKTEEKAMTETQVQISFGREAAESVKLARLALAQKLGIPVDDITASAVIGQEFSTNAFYCQTAKDRIAKDDAPAAISGFSILLSTSGRRYEYHASGQTIVFCRPLS